MAEIIKRDAYGIEIYREEVIRDMDTTFKLELRDRVTLIRDNSGTGKTVLADAMRNVIGNEESELGESKYHVIDSKANLNMIKQLKGKLILIDEADQILSKEVVNYINSDIVNDYIIIARKTWGLEGTLNALGKLSRKGNEITIAYEFNVLGW